MILIWMIKSFIHVLPIKWSIVPLVIMDTSNLTYPKWCIITKCGVFCPKVVTTMISCNVTSPKWLKKGFFLSFMPPAPPISK